MLQLTAPAKINFFLHVTGRRKDGFHELQSAVFFSDIGDRITLEEISAPTRLEVSGPFAAGVPLDESNLLLRAYCALKNACPDLPDFYIRLDKQLPVAAGLGGGSSDAAALLRALTAHEAASHLEPPSVSEILQSLGSDMTVCFRAQTALMEGTGHRLQPWPNMPDCGVLLVNPKLPLSTAETYQGLRRFHAGGAFTAPCGRDEWKKLAQDTTNDLQEPAMMQVPAIGDILTRLTRYEQSWLVRMSGSGATCFALFDDRSQAEKAATQLEKERPQWWIKAGGVYHGETQ